MRIVVFILLLLLPVNLTAAQVLVGDDAPLRFGRFQADDEVYFGFLSFGGIHQLDGDFLDETSQPTGWVYDPETVKLLSPLNGRRVFSIRNGFSSNMSFVQIPGENINGHEYPLAVKDGYFAGEMVVVIAKQARNISLKNAASHIYGVGGGVMQYSDIPPQQIAVGPWIVPGLSYNRLELQIVVNDKVVRKISSRKLSRSVERMIVWLSAQTTLNKGDIIFTGAPGQPLWLAQGDIIEVSLEGVGTLSNKIDAQACNDRLDVKTAFVPVCNNR